MRKTEDKTDAQMTLKEKLPTVLDKYCDCYTTSAET